MLPVGGTRPGPDGPKAITHCDKFMEPLSGLQVYAGSACLADGTVVPSSGGYQMLLDKNVLVIERQLVKALRDYSTAVTGGELVGCLVDGLC